MRVFLLLLLLALAAHAHPVAQGSLELDVQPGEIRATARVSNEEVFVQAAHAEPEPANIEAAWREHGAYLLGKMEVMADGVVLQGTVEKVEMPADHSVRGFAVYELRYPLAAPARKLELRQSLMNEIPYAPGNPWEATFLVTAKAGGVVVREGSLLTHREALVIPLDGATAPTAGVFREFLWHGIHHILEGWDHLLFMAALVLAVRGIRKLLLVVTAFTLAHTLMLTLSVFDIVRLRSSIVEPMIALSIVVVAVQNILRPRQSHGTARLVLAFGFGLFHGLGFAGGLLDAMSTGQSVGQSLIAFSLGVEIGHQVVVLPLFLGLMAIRQRCVRAESRERFSLRVVRAGSLLIAVAGCVYLVAALRGA